MEPFQPYRIIPPKAEAPGANILIVADHASAAVPPGIDLGIDSALLREHIALDIGVAGVSGMLCASLGCGAVLATVSRLVIDFNREEDAPGLVPVTSDGHAIPGNRDADVEARLNAYYRPYHAAVSRCIDAMASPFLLSLHSFTPRLASRPEEQRPWEIGVLYNQDDRAARVAIPLLEEAGLVVGDQLPYSGTELNATMNRHGEKRGVPYLGIEMRQDLVNHDDGRRRMASILAAVAIACRNRLAD